MPPPETHTSGRNDLVRPSKLSQSWRAVSSPESIEAPGRRIRIFLDASAIFAAAYSSTGASRELALAADIRDRRVLLVTAWVFEEAERNLQRKAPQGLPILRLLKDEALWTLIREPSRRQVLQAERVVAFKDAPVVAGALKARADFWRLSTRKTCSRKRMKSRLALA